ncbi:MAG TPA: hypothetical protein VFZ23_02280 [Pyrinomonadaceae bacterium]
MSLFNFKKIAIGLALGLTIAIAGNGEANAQSRREIERERQRIEREQRRIDRARRNNRSYNNRSYGRVIERANSAHFDHGYSQGLLAGQYDRRKGKYNQSNVYRGTGSYPNAGDPSSTDYIYRQGYLRGYNDGFYGGRPY